MCVLIFSNVQLIVNIETLTMRELLLNHKKENYYIKKKQQKLFQQRKNKYRGNIKRDTTIYILFLYSSTLNSNLVKQSSFSFAYRVRLLRTIVNIIWYSLVPTCCGVQGCVLKLTVRYNTPETE